MTTPYPVMKLCKSLQVAGHKAYVVGGAVRDSLLGREIHDWDVATSAKPLDVMDLFGAMKVTVVPTGLKHGTVTVVLDTLSIEVTTFRGDGDYSDGRHPDTVKFVDTIEEDLSRRDFTINAMALDPVSGNIVDPHGGREDLAHRMIRAVGDPDKRFQEDGLRPIRAIRFAAQLGFVIVPDTLRAISRALSTFHQVSWERKRDELLKILAVPDPSSVLSALEYLDATLLLHDLLPELTACRGQVQNRFHTHDVFDHSLLTVRGMAVPDPILRLTALLHDIGKPSTAQPSGEGCFSFLEHEVVGSQMADVVCQRLKLTNEDRERVVNLIRHHCRLISPPVSGPSRRRFIKAVGPENVESMLTLNEADTLSDSPRDMLEDRHARFLTIAAGIREEAQKKPPVSTRQLAIGGKEVMEALNLTPGPKVGEVLRTLMEIVLEDPDKNTPEALLAELKRIVSDSSSFVRLTE
jgi:putative nucleotidyltransferase with HDIG domain